MILTFADYLEKCNKFKSRSFLIICAGGSIREHSDKIERFIKDIHPITIGINRMTDFFVPNFHLWTNNERFLSHGDCIDKSSVMMFGAGLPKRVIETHYSGDYVTIEYSDKIETYIDYQNGKIFGHFRTAGCLAIMLAHLMGAGTIRIVGMDGFTFHKRADVFGGTANQHCYGLGYTDDYTWEDSIRKDKVIYDVLESLRQYGIDFDIVTPTMYEKVYDPSFLGFD